MKPVASDPNSRARRPLRRVLAVYNTDYDAELTADTGADVSAVEAAARAVAEAIGAAGYRGELVGVEGPDLGQLVHRLQDDPPDLVFNLCESLHGDAQNEVVVPAVLDMLRIPYTGPGALTIALCLHKDRTKQVLSARGIPTPPFRVLATAADLEAADLEGLDFPWFVKLAHEDASVGIAAQNRVNDAAALRRRARELMHRHRQPVIAERYVEGREINVTLIGNGRDVRALPLHEIDFAAMPTGRPHIVSYAAKWDERHEEFAGTRPVPLRDPAPELVRAVERVARDTFLALGLRDFGRVDVRVDDDGAAWVIDVNPNCDLSPDAGVARAAMADGVAYPRLIGEVCELGWRRYERDREAARAR